MITWRIEAVDFSTGFKYSRFISGFLHILFMLVCLMIGEYSVTLLHNKFTEEPESIELEIVNNMGEVKSLPVRKKTDVNENSQTPFNVLSEESKTLAFEPQVLNENAELGEENKKEVKKVFNRYEQQLSKHFYDHLPQLPKGVYLPKRLDLWIKIDISGTIHDFGFLPNPTDSRAQDFLENFVAMSNPVPPPENVENYLSQYIIPIEFFGVSK